LTEDYHTENGNIDQYMTLQQFKGCDIAQLLLSGDGIVANTQLTDYHCLLAASHTGVLTERITLLQFVDIATVSVLVDIATYAFLNVTISH